MIVRNITSANDWVFGLGSNSYVSGNAAAAVMIKTRLQCFLGNCFFDASSGLNWLLYLGGYKNQLDIQLAISACILNTVDESGNNIVTGIQQLSVGLNDASRAFSIQYQAVTIYSTVTDSFVYTLNGVGG